MTHQTGQQQQRDYEEFKIPPKYENPYSSDFHMYDILNDEFIKTTKSSTVFQSQRYDYPRSDNSHHSFVSVGSNGINFGVMT